MSNYKETHGSLKGFNREGKDVTHTAFCEVKSIDQVAALLKMASEQVLEEQKKMTKTLVLYDDKGKEVMSADFVNNGEINMDDVETLSRFPPYFRCRQMQSTRYYLIYAVRHKCDQSQPETFILY